MTRTGLPDPLRDALVATLRDRYGLAGELVALPGEVDTNLRLCTGDGDVLVKVAPCDVPPEPIDLQVHVLEHVAANASQLPVPRVLRARDGAAHCELTTPSGPRRVWLTSWLPGRLLAQRGVTDVPTCEAVGRLLARLDAALLDFEDPLADRRLRWDLLRADEIGADIACIDEPALRARVAAVHRRFVDDVAPRLRAARRAVVHNDANDHNLLVARDSDGRPSIGLIDFGDVCRTALIGEVAIAATYLAMAADDPLAAIDTAVRGYDAELPLTDEELALVVPLVETRLAVSLATAALRSRERPDDPYVTVSQAGAARLLEHLHGRDHAVAAARLRIACGRGPAAGPSRVAAFVRERRGTFAPVLDADLSKRCVLDLSFASLTAGDDPTTFDEQQCAERIARAARTTGAEVGVGRYREPRSIYSGQAFGGGAPNAARRTVHLGIDLFAAADTAVRAPLVGTVHCAMVCDGALDYGGLVVLRHELPDGTPFGTLYGHLDPASIRRLRPGDRVEAGARFAALGDEAHNGGWPPHLHLQLLAVDPVELPDVPRGVADPDDLTPHECVYPDPSDLLGLPAGSAAWRDEDDEQAAARRRAASFAGNLKLSYRQPFAPVRGWRHLLFDRHGRRHLDAYNNVPHVGHCHPTVVRAVQEQTALLATNTRYQHEAMLRYAERLRAMLPSPLSVFFFTPSGSEANELALRLVRAHTGAEHVCVMDHGYHGHTTGAMAISPYKFRQRGAPPQPDWVHVTVQPDVYRGAHHGDYAGPRYAAEVAATIAALQARGQRLAAYLCECLPSVGGQLELPPGFLTDVYAAVRAAGGLCIADDVQTALWRTGDHAFGFERHGVVPDVLVLGKPLGNGFPLGAVVTTPAVAASFAAGPEFFSTFGGSTVAMAAGLAVLDALEQDDLAANARRVGALLLDGLRQLQRRHEAIGDVRGRGLFLGVELVTDRSTQTPATAMAATIKERLRERRVLIGTDGPFDNVLKIRPPMTFDADAADCLLRELDVALALATDAASG